MNQKWLSGIGSAGMYDKLLCGPKKLSHFYFCGIFVVFFY